MFRSTVFLLPLLVAMACDSDAPDPAAEDGPVVDQAVRPPPQADVDVALPVLPEGKTLSVNVESSSIGFTGKKITGSHEGGFKAFEGTVVMGEGVIVGTSFSIDLAGTFADNEKLTGHLQSSDFFDIGAFPKARFVATDIQAAPNPAKITHLVNGVLELRGKRRPVSFPATIVNGQAGVRVQAAFEINRQNWGITFPGKPDDLISDDVEIRLDLTFPKSET